MGNNKIQYQQIYPPSTTASTIAISIAIAVNWDIDLKPTSKKN